MPIVSSTIVEDRAQADGRRSIRERHVDQLGGEQFAGYLAAVGFDAPAAMAARVPLLDAALVDGEHEANIGAIDGDGSPAFRHTTAAQFLVRLRAAYANATGIRAVRIGRFFHVQNLTNGVMDALFGTANATQRTALRNRFSHQNDLVIDTADETGQ